MPSKTMITLFVEENNPLKTNYPRMSASAIYYKIKPCPHISLKSSFFTFHYGTIQIIVTTCVVGVPLYFTFHYGTIQMELLRHQENVIKFFTFHYGTIQIKASVRAKLLCLALHSTMVLFKS